LPSANAALPWPLTPLFGRTAEIAGVSALLTRDDVRVVTLTGPPGIGKTRLAVQVARNLADAFENGVVYFALASLHDPALVLESIAHVMGIRPSGAMTVLETLTAHLHERACLLVLDNLEQIVDAASSLAELLALCPQVRLLLTSRVALNMRGEHRFIVPPLAVPASSAVSVQTLRTFPGTALFLEQALAIMPDFAPAPIDVAAIATICSRLDGLPLAIELTAARIGLLSPPALLRRLDHRLSLLDHGPRDLPPQQRTLREALDWSYDLLHAREQQIFRYLAIFAGEWSLDAAVHICDLPEDELLVALKTLIDSSLVQSVISDDDEGSRFMLLETIRAYGLERLCEQSEDLLVGRRHATYYAAYAEQHEPALQGPQAGTRQAEMTRSYDNLRAALAWAEMQNDVTLGIRLAAPLWRFWYLSGTLREGHHWFEAFLTSDAPASDLRVRALHGAGVIALELGMWDRAQALAQE
ncbi:MAG TPA: AAA family ATPase, partial [Ktedonobacterales bacterium]|nr:AAA family ATPase [Ktedonobacterales bacterium]